MVMLKILLEFDRICKKHKLKYWLDFGTLLGAVRHKGFIPWDDDLDVSMPREDYNKLLNIAQDELNQDYFFQNKNTDKNFFLYFSKIRDNNSFFVENHESEEEINYHRGIYIDIFPVNYIQSNIFIRATYSLLKKTIKLFSNRYINFGFIARPLIKITKLFHKDENPLVVRGGEMMTEELNIDKNSIFPLAKLEFENYVFNVPNDLDKYLQLFYGRSYMTQPPEHLRKSHHLSITIYKEQNI